MNKLQAGFGRSNITPPMGINISEYYKERIAEGVLDELEVSALALKLGDEGYFPMQDSYDEGGYEARSSRFAAGVAEYMIDEGKKLLADLRK